MKRVASVVAGTVVLTALLVSSALSQRGPPDYAAVPAAFHATLRTGVTREQFVSGEMNAFRAVARERPELDRDRVELAVASQKAAQRANAIAQLIAYDLNADGSVSREEVAEVLRFRFAGHNAERQLREVMRHDTDLNDILDPQEIRTAGVAAAERAGAATSPAERLLGIAGPDKVLRAADLYRAAERAFDIVDLNGDMVLSQGEWAAFREAVGPPVPGRAPAPRAKPAEPPTRGADEEIHLVGIYEGFDPVSDRTRGDRVLVAVDRPGRKVTLLLCSHGPVRWSVTLSPGTELSELRAFGRAIASEFVVNDVRRRPEPLAGGLDCPYKPMGDKFRALVASLRATTGFSRLSSFAGSYTALKVGFVADRVSEAPELGPNHLLATPPDDAGSGYRFWAELRGVPGLYDLRGQIAGKGASGDGIRSVDVPGTRERYRIAEDGLIRVLPGERTEDTQIPLPPGMPPFSHPSGIAYDTKRERVVVVSYGGRGILYEYDVRLAKWRIIAGMENRDVKGLIYDGSTDRLWGVEGTFAPAALVAMGPDGNIVRSIRLDPRKMPGLSDLYDPGNNSPNLRLALADGKNAILVAVGKQAQYRIYLVDLSSGATSLTAFSDN